MEEEQILGVVYGADGQVGRMSLMKTYDLIFTDRRLVGAIVSKTGAARLVGHVVGGAIGGAIAGKVAKGGADTKRASYVGLSLEDITASDKANFSTPYNRVEKVKVKGLVTKYLHMKMEGKKAVFKIPKQQLAQAKALVAGRIPGAKT